MIDIFLFCFKRKFIYFYFCKVGCSFGKILEDECFVVGGFISFLGILIVNIVEGCLKSNIWE